MTTTTPSLTWTASAQAAFEAFLARRFDPAKLDGADPDEVSSDLRAHVQEELLAAGVTVVTAESLQQVLAQMGEPLPAPEAGRPWEYVVPPVVAPAAQLLRGYRAKGTFRRPGWFIFWTVVLPLAAFLFEVFTRAAADSLFDPMPDWPHHMLVLLVPLSGIVLHRTVTRRAGARSVVVASWLAGAAAASALFYSVLFLPLLPYAAVGIVFFGLGLLCYAPVLGFFGLMNGLTVLREYRAEAGVKARHPAKLAFWLTLLLIAALELPSFLTRTGLHMAASEPNSITARAEAAKFIRRWGSEKSLLTACYDIRGDRNFGRAAPDPAAWISRWFGLKTGLDGWRDDGGATVARDLYFRVSGVPFNATERPWRAPAVVNGMSGFRGSRIDRARGGTRVAGIIPGLALGESRLDWHCESASGLAWGEWTLTFTNSDSEPQEARCLVALPQDGFVSRVNLWVNGEMQEAAYSTTGQVRAAYQKVAVQQRRDPVLVTQPAPGSVMVQAFPVPAGGQLKTRISFTAPAGPDGRVWLPAIIERNFDIPPGITHALWAQADGGTLTCPPGVTFRNSPEQGQPVLTASLKAGQLDGSGLFLNWHAQPAPLVWCEDLNAPDASRIVVRRLQELPKQNPRDIAVVVDGSRGLRAHLREISDATNAVAGMAKEMKVFIPGDTSEDLSSDIELLMMESTFAGGRDNTPALRAALEWLRGRDNGLLIWLHGPQPLEQKATLELEQILERSPSRFTICDVALVPGENTISPLFNGRPRLQSHCLRHKAGTLADSLKAMLTNAPAQSAAFTEQAAGTMPPDGAVKVSDSIARWRAMLEAHRMAPNDPSAAGLLAAKHQVVTPWSGAVVLERASDYKASGLEQSTSKVAQTVPVIPEPSVALLCASSLLILTRRRRAASPGDAVRPVSAGTAVPARQSKGMAPFPCRGIKW